MFQVLYEQNQCQKSDCTLKQWPQDTSVIIGHLKIQIKIQLKVLKTKILPCDGFHALQIEFSSRINFQICSEIRIGA